jgi:hypothetical protein
MSLTASVWVGLSPLRSPVAPEVESSRPLGAYEHLFKLSEPYGIGNIFVILDAEGPFTGTYVLEGSLVTDPLVDRSLIT